jgi:hypothetical protein
MKDHKRLEMLRCHAGDRESVIEDALEGGFGTTSLIGPGDWRFIVCL